MVRRAGHVRVWSVVVALLLGPAVGGCGPERSTESYCSTLRDRLADLRGKYEPRLDSATNDDDPLSGMLVGLGSMLEAQGDLASLFEDLAKVAPPEIEADSVRVAEAMRKQVDATANMGSDPLGGMVSGLFTGLQNMGAIENIDRFQQENCALS